MYLHLFNRGISLTTVNMVPIIARVIEFSICDLPNYNGTKIKKQNEKIPHVEHFSFI
jgi:hypothetical protein